MLCFVFKPEALLLFLNTIKVNPLEIKLQMRLGYLVDILSCDLFQNRKKSPYYGLHVNALTEQPRGPNSEAGD